MNRIILFEKSLLKRCILNTSFIGSQHPQNCSHNEIICLRNHHQIRKYSSPSIWNSISESAPVNFLQELTINLHDVSGIPWWSTIILSTFLLRSVITFPLALYQNKILAKVEKLTTEEMPKIAKELKIETSFAVRKFNWNEQQAKAMYLKSLNKQWKNLIIRDNCHPMKSAIVLIVQLPLWIFQSMALRNLIFMQPDPSLLKAQIVCAEMSLGGFVWIQNLTEVDHSYILPVTLGLINLAILEIQVMSRKVQTSGKLQKYGQYFFRTVSILMIPIAAFVPSGLALYWVSSSSFGLIQNLLLLSPKIRRLAKIPKVNSEHDHPYKFLLEKIKERIKN